MDFIRFKRFFQKEGGGDNVSFDDCYLTDNIIGNIGARVLSEALMDNTTLTKLNLSSVEGVTHNSFLFVNEYNVQITILD